MSDDMLVCCNATWLVLKLCTEQLLHFDHSPPAELRKSIMMIFKILESFYHLSKTGNPNELKVFADSSWHFFAEGKFDLY